MIFSYPHLVRSKPLPYDIISKHYAKVTGNLGDKNLPLLHDEFAHVSCYNLERLQQDNSVRDFWGESIQKGWDRKAPYSVYPEGHIGRPNGTAYPSGFDNPYGVKPDTFWSSDNENYFLYPKSHASRGISNDFFTRRNHIRRYTVSLANGKNLEVFGEKSDINAYVCRSQKDNGCFELQITAGCYYPDLQWGNDFGKRYRKWKDRCIEFSLSCIDSD